MNDKHEITKHEIGNTTYYIKSSVKANAIQDFTSVIQRLIKKEIERKQYP